MPGNNPTIPYPYADLWVIYPSRLEPGQYVAHSLRTDQVGVGDCVLDAYLELAANIRGLLREAKRDPRIEIYQEAPPAIWKLAAKARPLPREIEEIAAQRLTGHMPESEHNHIPRYRKPRKVVPPQHLVDAS